MNNLIIYHFLFILLTIVNCGKFSTIKTPITNLQKTKFKYWLNLIIGILLLFLIILILILFYIFYIRQRIKKSKNNNKNERVKRQNNEYDIPIISYNINELDTIQTVGTPSEFIDHYSETEVKTII